MITVAPFRTWSLKTKFALCSGALMFAFSVAFTTWTLRTVEADVRGSVTDAQTALVRSTAEDIEEKIDLRRDALTTIAGLLPEAAPAPGPEMDAFFEARPVLRKMFDAVLVVDASGRVVHDLPHRSADASTGIAVGDRVWFRQVMAGSPLVISSPEKSLVGGEPFIVFAAPLRSREGKVTGSLICSLNLVHPNFLGHLGEVRIGRGGYFAIVERSAAAKFVMHGDRNRIMTPAPGGSTAPLMAEASVGDVGHLTGVNYQGIETLRSFTLLRSVPWVLIAVYPAAEAFAGVRARQREVLWVGGGLFVVASILAWLMSGWLLRPLTGLRDALDHQASDSGRVLPPADFGSAELAALVTAFNAQAARRREFEQRLKDSERRMKDVTDNIPARIAHVDLDERYTFANARSGLVGGGDSRAMIGRTLREVRGTEIYDAIAPQVARALGGETVSFERTALEQGRLRYQQIDYIPELDDSGRVRGFYAMTFDITAQKEAQALQARVEARLRAITDNLSVLISYIDKDERYGFLNATFKSWLGIDPATAVGRSVVDVIGAEVYSHRRDKIERCLAGERVTFETEAHTLVGKRILQIVYTPDFGPDGQVAGYYTLSSDVTELKNAQHQLALLVRSDPLTGLPNRYQFNETLPLAMSRCAESGLALALMFIDIDHFKQVNDAFGHGVGDVVLREFAQRLRRSVRSTDVVTRLGGDEFVVILEGLHSDAEPQFIARKILAEINRPFDIGGRMVAVTTSMGIAFYALPEGSASEVLAKADAALYEAKAAGRNRYRMSSG